MAEITAVASAEELARARKLVKEIRMEAVVEEYIVSLVRATRPRQPNSSSVAAKFIEVGASPRATLALGVAARAHAFLMRGRGYATPDDVKAVARDVLRHRLLLNYEAEADGFDADIIITKLLDSVPTP